MKVSVNYNIELDERDAAVLDCLNDNLANYLSLEEAAKAIRRVKDSFVEAELHRRILAARVSN